MEIFSEIFKFFYGAYIVFTFILIGILWTIWIVILKTYPFIYAYLLYRLYRWKKSLKLLCAVIIATFLIFLYFTWDRLLSEATAMRLCADSYKIELDLDIKPKKPEKYDGVIRKDIAFEGDDPALEGRYIQTRAHDVVFFRVTKSTLTIEDTLKDKILVELVTYRPSDGKRWRGSPTRYCNGEDEWDIGKNKIYRNGKLIHISELTDISDKRRW